MVAVTHHTCIFVIQPKGLANSANLPSHETNDDLQMPTLIAVEPSSQYTLIYMAPNNNLSKSLCFWLQGNDQLSYTHHSYGNTKTHAQMMASYDILTTNMNVC